MELAVLLQEQGDGTYQARAPAIRGLVVTAPSRAVALTAIGCAAAEVRPASDLVVIDVPGGPDAKPNPWLEMAGLFADDPTLEKMLKEIYAARDAERP